MPTSIPKRRISNREFEAARTPEIQTYIQNVARTYAKQLSSDVRQSSGDIALWRCLQSHNPNGGNSFTSSLYNFVHWECRRALTLEQRKCATTTSDIESTNDNIITQMVLDDYLGLLGSRERRIVEARFLESCTLLEVATREGLTKQGVRNIVQRAISLMAEAAQDT
jgi:RNA polymerase sigma factor (sigma-70 family)